ncbi:hypothetical protein EZS27_018409 [termite gut metagenome]|uniref:Uncharacterized protein n=1 Tax=termite gut metagenome TaxID=433724 RepID=A0A5J4RIG1_9ZZZZ
MLRYKDTRIISEIKDFFPTSDINPTGRNGQRDNLQELEFYLYLHLQL